jgi:hypothetical protein
VAQWVRPAVSLSKQNPYNMNPTNKTAKQVQQAAAHINAGNLGAGIRMLEAVKRACLNKLDQMYLERLISELKKTA